MCKEKLEKTAEEEEETTAEEVSTVVGGAGRVGTAPAHQLTGEGRQGDDEAGKGAGVVS